MKRDSWHYKAAKFANESRGIHDGELSICEYCQKVFWGCFAIFAIGLILSSLAVGGLVGLYQIVGWMFGFVELGYFGVWLACIITVIGSITGYVAGKKYWRRKSEMLMREDNQGFVAKAYKSYKEKICFSVNFE